MANKPGDYKIKKTQPMPVVLTDAQKRAKQLKTLGAQVNKAQAKKSGQLKAIKGQTIKSTKKGK
jgi:predicted ATPase